MNTRQIGVVLLTTIIMIVVITMLVLTLMHSVFLYFKISNQVVRRHEILYQLEAVAHKLAAANNELTPSDCILTETDPNQMIDMLLHNNGCSLTDTNRQYYYLLDDLGLYPCLQILLGNKVYSSHHWLISVATPPPQQTILQLRVAKPFREMACDLFEERRISNGVISWRYLA